MEISPLARPLTSGLLERAIDNNELMLHFQPKINLLNGQVVGAEALARWSSNDELLPPEVFLPIALESGLLLDLTLRLLDELAEASEQLKQDAAARPSRADVDPHSPVAPFAISMNVSTRDLESGRISARIAELFERGSLLPGEIQIEVTESDVMQDVDHVQSDLQRLTAMGVRLLMDDFGIGYSSIDRLSQLPFDVLKLDKGVVKRMSTSRQSLDVVRSSISMARELGMSSVAEGVENAMTCQLLTTNGCEEAQGYFFAKPMSLTDLRAYVDRFSGREGSQIGRVHQASLDLIRYRKSFVDAFYCSAGSLPSSVRDEFQARLDEHLADSRIGHWYFGVGQYLAGQPVFRAIEQPLRQMHRSGSEIGARLLSGDGRGQARLQQLLVEFDAEVDRVLRLLHELERLILCERLDD